MQRLLGRCRPPMCSSRADLQLPPGMQRRPPAASDWHWQVHNAWCVGYCINGRILRPSPTSNTRCYSYKSPDVGPSGTENLLDVCMDVPAMDVPAEAWSCMQCRIGLGLPFWQNGKSYCMHRKSNINRRDSCGLVLCLCHREQQGP